MSILLLKEAVKCAAIMTSDKSAAVKFAFSSTGVKITANIPEIGSAEETYAMSFDREEIEIEIDMGPKYVLKALEGLDADIFSLSLNDALSPVLIKSEDHF